MNINERGKTPHWLVGKTKTKQIVLSTLSSYVCIHQDYFFVRSCACSSVCHVHPLQVSACFEIRRRAKRTRRMNKARSTSADISVAQLSPISLLSPSQTSRFYLFTPLPWFRRIVSINFAFPNRKKRFNKLCDTAREQRRSPIGIQIRRFFSQGGQW